MSKPSAETRMQIEEMLRQRRSEREITRTIGPPVTRRDVAEVRKSLGLPSSRGRKAGPLSDAILMVGFGDIIRKLSQRALTVIKEKGYRIFALEIVENPTGLSCFEPDKIFLFGKDYKELVRVGNRRPFNAIYVASPSQFHISHSLLLHNIANGPVICTKPLDTNVPYLLHLKQNEENFRFFLEDFQVHEHYLAKPAIRVLIEHMPQLLADHGFLKEIQMYLVEKDPIEVKEPHRIASLQCGVLFDVATHLLSILQAILPEYAEWIYRERMEYERMKVDMVPVACNVGKDPGSILGLSTVFPEREAETFGLVELLVKEEVRLKGSGAPPSEKKIRVLITVGKGVPPDGVNRDLKSIWLKFIDGYEVIVDYESCRFKGISDDEVARILFKFEIDERERGINFSIAKAAENQFDVGDSVLQPFYQALLSVQRLWDALKEAPPNISGHKDWTCLQLMNELLRGHSRFSRWELPTDFGSLAIGSPPPNAIP